MNGSRLAFRGIAYTLVPSILMCAIPLVGFAAMAGAVGIALLVFGYWLVVFIQLRIQRAMNAKAAPARIEYSNHLRDQYCTATCPKTAHVHYV